MTEHGSSLHSDNSASQLDPTAIIVGGLDGLEPETQERLAEILDRYLEDLEHGKQQNPEDLIRMHPGLAEPLRRYLRSLNLLHHATSLCHSKAEPTASGQLGDFQIVGELGRGGMGIVYQARQISLGRLVALKVLPFAAVLDHKQVARFQNEAQAAAQLHHPHIVPVYAVGCERGVHYYSMQFIDGQSLDQAMSDLRSVQPGAKTAPLGRTSQLDHDSQASCGQTARGFTTERSIRSRNYVRAAVKLVIDAAEALDYAHECGVIHRDVKPSNLLIDRHGKLWVTDFGLARCQNVSNITATGDFFGTLRYMSPEQASGQMALVDHRSDVYSLGVTLFELLTLRTPFDVPERAKLLRQIAEVEPPSPRSLNPTIPSDLENILLKTLRKSREERYPTAGEFAADLRRFLAGEPTRARRPTMLDRAGKWVSRHGKLVATGFMLALLAIATVGAAAIMLAREQERTQTALQQAELHLRVAREMVDDLGARLAEDLEGIPATEHVRLQALERSQIFYRDFLRYAAEQSRWQRDAAIAAFKRGAILEKLGRTNEAIDSYHEAGVLFNLAAGTDQKDPQLEADAALCKNNLALLISRERPIEGLRLLRSSESELAVLRDRFPQAERISDDLCLVQLNLGTELSKAGHAEEARGFIVRSVARIRESLKPSPESPTAMRRLAIGLRYLSELQADRSEATDSLQEAISLHRNLLGREPNRVEHSSELATALTHLGSLRIECGNVESAQRLFEESLGIRRQLIARSPTNNLQIELAAALNNFGMAQLDTDLVAAEKLFDESLSLLLDLVRRAPADSSLRCELAAAINNRGLVRERQGKIAEAISAFRQAIAEQELVVARSGELPAYRHQLDQLQSNLHRALQADRIEPVASTGNST